MVFLLTNVNKPMPSRNVFHSLHNEMSLNDIIFWKNSKTKWFIHDASSFPKLFVYFWLLYFSRFSSVSSLILRVILVVVAAACTVVIADVAALMCYNVVLTKVTELIVLMTCVTKLWIKLSRASVYVQRRL